MARFMRMTEDRYQHIESSKSHECPRDGAIECLRDHMALPEWRERLVIAGYPWPWAESDWR